MTTLRERVEAWCAQHKQATMVIDPADGLLPAVTMECPIEGGYLMRDNNTSLHCWFDFKDVMYRIPAKAAIELLKDHRECETLASTTRSEQLQIIGEQMKAIAEPWLRQHCPERLEIMLDVEGFGDCLPSLAIVPFDSLTGECLPVEACVLLTLDIDWQQRAGLLCNQDTLRWWLTKTSDDARRTLYDLPGSYHIRTPEQLGDYFDLLPHAWGLSPTQEHHRVWCKPGSYDWPKLARLCQAAGVRMPFHFRTSRCLRTSHDLGPKPTKDERDRWKAENDIVTHDPYDDCRLQAWEAAQALQKPSFFEQPHGGSDGRSFYPGRFYRFMPKSLASVKYATMPICRFITTHPEDGGTAIVEVFNQGTQDVHYINADWDQLREEADHSQWLRSI